MKFLKIGLYSLLLALVLLIVGAGIFLATFDEQMLKSTLVEAVKQKTGRTLTIETIQPTIFPWLGAELGRVALSNATGFEAEQMLMIEQLNIHLELLPLLKREINIDTLQVNGLKLFLEKNKQAITNWNDLLNPPTEKVLEKTVDKTIKKAVGESVPVESAADARPEASTVMDGLRVQGIDINGADIHWHDALTGKKVEIQRLNIKTGAVTIGLPLLLQVSSQLDLPESNMTMTVKMATRLTYDATAQRIAMDELVLSIDAEIKKATIETLQLNLKTQLTANIEKQRVAVPAFELVLNAQGSGLPDKQLKVTLEGSVALDFLNQTASIKPLILASEGLSINSQIQIEKILKSPELTGQIDVPSFNPAALARSKAIELPKMQSKTALTHAALKGQFHVTEKQLTLKQFKLIIDQSTADIKFKLDNFEQPKINMNVALNRINLDDYLPPSIKPKKLAKLAKNKTSTVASRPKGLDEPIELPVEMLRALNVRGRFAINNLQAFNSQVNNVKLQVKAKQGRINISELTAQLLGGSISATTQLDVRQKIPRYNMVLNSRNIEIKTLITPMLISFSGKDALSLSGASNMSINLLTRGESVSQLKSQLNGALAVSMGESKLHGVDVEYFAHQDMVAFLEKNKLDIPDHLKKAFRPKTIIALKVAKFTANIKQGVIENKDLLLESSKMKITGAGNINLPAEKLNYQLAVSWRPNKKDTMSDRLIALPMPVKINGSFSQPDVTVDWKSRLKAAKKLLKTEAKDKAKDKVERKLERKVDKLKGKLKNLFN